MSDLSRLLGDVYGTGEPDAPSSDAVEAPADAVEAPSDPAEPATRPGTLPEWADESVLDEAFANWVPGPATDAPAAERSLLTELAGERTAGVTSAAEAPVPVEERPTTLVEAVPSAPDFLFPEGSAEELPAPVTVPGRWQREDDDLLPARPKARRRRR